MLNIHLTLPMVVNFLRVIAEREPERVGKSDNGGCVYANVNGHILTPVCIVGQMFADMGLLRLLMVTPSNVDYGSALSSACGVSSMFWDNLAAFGITVDEDAKAFAHNVQRKQDDEVPWGPAFDSAVKDYRDEQQRILDERLSDLFG